MKNTLYKILSLLFLIISPFLLLHAQISPPGLGKAKTASWSAIGLKRQLDSTGTKEALTYLGLGTKSTPDDSNPFHKQAILVLNHEVYHKFAKNQQYSYALSYRRQNVYDADAPYHGEGVEQEFRLYGRYAYTFRFGERWKWKNTVRQEFRKFLLRILRRQRRIFNCELDLKHR